MGQRTQILLQKVNSEGNVRNEFYHYQWGYGTVMYKELMSFVLDIENNLYNSYHKSNDILSFSLRQKQKKLKNFEMEQDFYQEWLETIQSEEIFNKKFIKEIIKYGDNNNGYLIIQLVENSNRDLEMNFAFVDNSTGKITDFLTWQEYAEKHGFNYIDEHFKNMFESFIKYYEINDMAQFQ
ncbi:hypothetical protein [Nosocomiicoccus sp. HMSC059G07]|uniref:hypothetical protein n=1 Tax=Nosocomiicoccus sp. HMSC059G07 TaxID=1739531 RepID=UPI0008A3D52E|nr:hypothetical protein [Nosocomiicoccus sp. HMSC059G07]OFO55285.1 hypothetical protein HMPREF3029_04505 [Nosocomiicoccus sp. HMSC059G07]